MKSGFSGSQPVRWNSGRMATWQPLAAALRISVSALAKFAAGSFGYWVEKPGVLVSEIRPDVM